MLVYFLSDTRQTRAVYIFGVSVLDGYKYPKQGYDLLQLELPQSLRLEILIALGIRNLLTHLFGNQL